MANKVAAVLALAALLALSTASAAYTTTVVTTTTVTDDDETNPQQTCQKEIKQTRMTHCMQYMMQGRQYDGESYEPSFLRSAVANPRQQGEEEHLQECCDELKQVSSECRGEAVRRVMVGMKQKYGSQEEMWRMIKDKAHAIPRKCNFKTPY